MAYKSAQTSESSQGAPNATGAKAAGTYYVTAGQSTGGHTGGISAECECKDEYSGMPSPNGY